MHVDDLAARMRAHETVGDRPVAAGVHMVARLDTDATRTPALLRRLRVELELPHGEGYAAFVRDPIAITAG